MLISHCSLREQHHVFASHCSLSGAREESKASSSRFLSCLMKLLFPDIARQSTLRLTKFPLMEFPLIEKCFSKNSMGKPSFVKRLYCSTLSRCLSKNSTGTPSLDEMLSQSTLSRCLSKHSAGTLLLSERSHHPISSIWLSRN